jgi:RNA polymerase sigma factor (sigma-70 family)
MSAVAPATETATSDSSAPPDFAALVEAHYRPLYRFAFGLAGDETQAADLTQQTFYLWALRGHQLRDGSKAKAWLFTTLRREFLRGRFRQVRFPQVEFGPWLEETTAVDANVVNALDGTEVMRVLQGVDEIYREPLLLFYLHDFSYAEIAETLGIRLGTVMSRLSRGKADLRLRLGLQHDSPTAVAAC